MLAILAPMELGKQLKQQYGKKQGGYYLTPVEHAHRLLQTRATLSQNDDQHTATPNDSVLPISHSVSATPMQTPVDEPAKPHYDSVPLNLDDSLSNLPDLETTPVKHAHAMLETQNATLISQNDIQHTATLNDSVLPISHSVGATPMQNPAENDPQSNPHYDSLPMNLANDSLMLIQPSSSRRQDIPALLPPMLSQSSPTTNKANYEYCNDN